MDQRSYSVIVPCYNTQKIFEQEIEEIQKVFREKLGTDRFEVILVNDCSPDKETLPFLKRLQAEYPFVTLVDLVRNTGQANAEVAAMHFTKGDIVINLDDDMQTHPKHIPALIEKLDEGYDVVLGKYISKKHSRFRNLLTNMDDRFEEVFLNKPKGMKFTSFWVARRTIVNEIMKYRYAYSFMEGLFLRTTRNIANVEIEHFERVEGRSGYDIKALFKLWSNFTNFTIKPLRAAGIIGAVMTLLGFIFTVITIVNRLRDPSVPQGYSALMCLMLLFFGVVMLMLGIIGEYVGRIFMCINSEPQFIVKDVYSHGLSGAGDGEPDDFDTGAENGNER